MRGAEIRAADARARQGFNYVTDGVFDTWRSHAVVVVAGEAWEGDCDDLASTVLDLLGRAGLALERRFRLLVSSAGDGRVDHMVGAVMVDDGTFLIVGDTFGPAYGPAFFGHQPIAYQRLDEWSGADPVWRDGLPWG